jgi:hypothetical protein
MRRVTAGWPCPSVGEKGGKCMEARRSTAPDDPDVKGGIWVLSWGNEAIDPTSPMAPLRRWPPPGHARPDLMHPPP